jgi:hypothetical protein
MRGKDIATTNTKWIYVTMYVFFVQWKFLRSLGEAYTKVIAQPRVFLPIPIWYESDHVNGGLDIEHDRNHLITGQWCEPLTILREITINVNDSKVP